MTPKALILGCFVALSALACQSQAAPASENAIDQLVLGLDEVTQISGFNDFTREVDTDQPGADDYAPEGPCQSLSDQLVAFGDTWTQFRSVADNGELDVVGVRRPPVTSALTPLAAPLMVSASQTMAVYPSEAAAGAVFDRRVTALTECAGLDIPIYSGTISRPTPTTVVHTSGDGGLTVVIANRSTVLVDVSVVGLPDAERIASDISQEILDRVVTDNDGKY